MYLPLFYFLDIIIDERINPNERSTHSQSDISIGHKGLTGCKNQSNLDTYIGHKGQAGGRHQNKPTKMSLHLVQAHFFWRE
ncbi:hypothetical protein HMPREF0493_0178 [Lactobacillus amylolyticus DSM 11664]|uniref:Uncharacterized protein n=1 Tax=Lactobacillus amylolyticus DSM 11664 TaxID=585524 RepID=D4YRQ0_9LACO|nr:hypothetical protein HMPREF0493_0178 [Lactobacillus amylolyticus DSM 11664]